MCGKLFYGFRHSSYFFLRLLLVGVRWLRSLYFSAYKFSFKLKSFTYSCHVTRSGVDEVLRWKDVGRWVYLRVVSSRDRRAVSGVGRVLSWGHATPESESLIYGLTLECNHIHLKKCITFGSCRCPTYGCHRCCSCCNAIHSPPLHFGANNFYCTWA